MPLPHLLPHDLENCSLLAGMSSQKAPESVVKKIFDMLDTKKDGVLDKEEVCVIICSQKECHALFGALHNVTQFIRKNRAKSLKVIVPFARFEIVRFCPWRSACKVSRRKDQCQQYAFSIRAVLHVLQDACRAHAEGACLNR
jgi:hypothetical protein